MRQDIDYGSMASAIMLTKESLSSIMDRYGVQFRKRKDVADIKKAAIKSHKKGMFKIEYELGFMEIYLKQDIFKRRKHV